MNAAAELPRRYDWPVAALCFGALLAVLVVLFLPTWSALLDVWLESGTYSHGVLVFPAVAYLAWRKRAELAAVTPRASWLGVAVLAGLMILWYVARVGSVQVVEQFALIAAIGAAVPATLGLKATRVLAFALLFMFFAVPVGDALIPHLMQFTAWFTVLALELSGIPVYQDGFMLSIPSGDFEVAKACSGIRYLIASISLGTLFAYLTFHSFWRRVAFVALSALLPILANGLRAYGIVMIAHLSDLKHAVGVDHLIYGWLFFGVVMFVLFWIGGYFRDKPPESVASAPAPKPAHARSRGLAVTGVALLCAVSVPGLYAVARASAQADIAPSALPEAVGPWRGPLAADDAYVPAFENYDAIATGAYERDGQRIEVAIVSYTGADNEIVNVRNVMARAPDARVLATRGYALDVGGERWELAVSDISAGRARRAVVHWYQVDRQRTASGNVAKLYEWLAKLRGRPVRRALVAVSVATIDAPEQVPAVDAFLAAHGARLVDCVAEPQATGCAAGPR